MKQISSSEFRRRYTTLSEPTEVLAFDEPIGEWYPHGTGKAGTTAEPKAEEAPAAEPRMTIRPAHPRRRRIVATTKRVLDPLAMRDQARTREDEMTPRQFVRKQV